MNLRPTDEQPIDFRQRSIAADISRSVVVQAPAGSGKTTLLVERMANLLTVVDRPEEILAITFTRKAAAEMRDRVLAILDDDSERSVAIRQRGLALGWQLENLPSRLRIQTIDGFCMALAQRLPIASGLGDGIRIIEDAEFLYAEAVDRLFSRLRTADPFTSELIAILELFENDYERARASMVAMLARRDQWVEVVSSTLSAGGSASPTGADEYVRRNAIAHAIEAGIESLHHAAIADVETDLGEELSIEISENAALAAKRLGRAWPWANLPEDIDDWRFIAELVATQDGKPRSRLGSAQGFKTGSANKAARVRLRSLIDDLASRGLIERLSSLRTLPEKRLDDADLQSIVAVATGLALAALELNDLFRRDGAIDFQELSFAARRALGEPESPTDVALALDYRIRHLLIDEFQDTSAAQHHLISRLIQEWQNDEDRSLFVVGDPMQSIYRFRDADVALFQRTRRNGIASIRPEPVQLTSNFRSSRALVDWFNRVFGNAFGSAEDPVLGRVAFSGSAAVRDARDGDGCRVVVVASDNGAGDDKEAGLLVEEVRRIRQEHPGESIAVLARNRSHLAPVLLRLSAQRVPWVGTDVHSLSDRPIISDLMSLVRAISSPDDRLAWLALLRTPFVGVSLKDLEVIARLRGDIATTIRNGAFDHLVSDDARTRFRRIRPVLIHTERLRGQVRIRTWIENAFIRLGGVDAYDDVDAIAHLERFLNVLEEGHARTLDIQALARSVARLYAESSGPPDAITAMTIHRAKGLEFDHVFVPGLQKVNRLDDPPAILWRPEGDQLLLGVDGSKRESSVHRWLRREERHRESNEQIRLLYVAATRARHTLHLSAALESEQGSLRPPPSRSLLSAIWPIVRDEAQIIASDIHIVDAIAATRVREVLPVGYVWRPPVDIQGA